MTRFELELSGKLGDFWKKDAEKELAKIRKDIEDGYITFDENGVAYNKIGRIVMSDMAEKIAHVTDKIDVVATAEARDAESAREIAEYREAQKNRSYSEEELFEMRSAFGAGTTIVDVLTGKTITL